MRRRPILLAILVPALSSAVGAYTLTGYRWTEHRVEFRLNPNFPEPERAGTREEQIETIRCAADVWTEQSRAQFQLLYAGTTARNRFNAGDGENSLFYASADGQGAVAATLITGDDESGAQETFDIAFFATSFDDRNLFRVRGEPQAGEFDLGGVATHELGHALGLGHTDVLEATMYPEIIRRALELRTLDADDVAGVETLYGLRTDVLPAVAIETVSPAEGPWEGGTEVLITGRRFTYTADTLLSLGDEPVPRELWAVEGCDRIRIPAMPAHAPGPVDIRVTNSLGSAMAAAAFRFGGPSPRVTGVAPAEGPITGGIQVTVTGDGFTHFAAVTVAGRPLEDAVRTSPTTIEGTLPPGDAAGPADVRLVQGTDEAVLPGALTYRAHVLEAPTLVAAPGEEGLDLAFRATHPDPLAAATFAFTYPAALLEVRELTVEGTSAAAAELLEVDIDNAAGATTVRIVMKVGGAAVTIPAGSGHVLARAAAAIRPAAAGGAELPLGLADGAGTPPVALAFLTGGGSSVRPFPVPGKVTVVALPSFVRGDANGDGGVNITDPIFHLDYLFKGSRRGPCDDASDANDDGLLDISDAVRTLQFLFQGDAVIPPPSPGAGPDPTEDALGCTG